MATAVSEPRNLLLDSLHRIGYGRDHIELNWPYLNIAALSSRIAHSSSCKLDIAAFDSDRRRDWGTSAIVCDLQSSDVLSSADAGQTRCKMLFDATASPNVIFGGHDTIDLWIKCETSNPRRIAGIGFNAASIRRAFDDNRESLERESLARLRGGQRFLFDRVYDARRDQLAEFIHVGLDQSVREFRQTIGQTIAKETRETLELSLSHVAMALLAARIMEDKDFFGHQDEQSSDARRLIERAESESNGFFGHVLRNDLFALDKHLGKRNVDVVLSHIMAHLTGPACFSLITPDMLGDLYERALVANDRVARTVDIKGIHYTPLTISQEILQRIPIEEIPPTERCILDPACGSGSFLMAATDRLRNAFDANEPDVEDDVTNHLRSRVIGNDLDDIARLVTGMRYLLHHWIETGSPDGVPTPQLTGVDGLELKPSNFDGVRPTVVVGNPPFNPSKSAANFLKASIKLLPTGGFLGMLMPASFLRSRRDGSAAARFELLDTCELLDVWEIPEGTIGISAQIATCAIIARKGRLQRRRPAMFKVANARRSEIVTAFRDHLRSTWTFVADSLPGTNLHWRDDPSRVSNSNSLCRIIASPIDPVWMAADSSHTLGQLCGDNLGLGIQACGPESDFSNDEVQPTGFEPYLQYQGSLVPYFIERSDWLGENNAENARGRYINPATAKIKKLEYWDLFRGVKLLITGATNRNARTQMTAAVDELGLFPEDHIHCLGIADRKTLAQITAPTLSGITDRSLLLWICAILNSPLGQAWIAMSSSPRGMTADVLRTLPIPRNFDSQIPDLLEMSRHLQRPSSFDEPTVWSLWSNRPANRPGTDFATISGQLNRLVFRSYGLSHADFERVKVYLKSSTDPWVNGEATAHIIAHPERRIRGTIRSIDTAGQKITLSLPRYSSDPLAIQIPHDFPGWALEPGMEFTCLAPRNDRDPQSVMTNPWLLREFRPLPYAYLSAVELKKMVIHEQSGE